MRMNVMRYLPLILALLWWPPPAIATQTPSGAHPESRRTG